MTPEEQAERDQLVEQIERKRLIQQIEAKRQNAEPEPQADVGRGLLRALGEGATLGFADNATAALTAAAAKINPFSKDNMMLDDTQSFGDIYRDTLGLEREGLQQFREENPKTAMAAELAGGLTTGGLGGTTRAVGGSALKNAMGRGGRIAGESAVAGVGAGNADTLGEAAQDATIGAGLGLGMSGGMKLAGALPRAVARRNVRPMLENKAGEFTPIPLTGEKGFPQRFYRGIVGRSWGGADELDNQIAPFRNRANAAVDEATAAKQGLTETLAKEKKAGVRQIEDTLDARRNQTLDALDEQARKLDAEVNANVERFRAEGARAPEALQQVGRQVDEANAALRRDVTQASLPRAAGDLKDSTPDMDVPTARGKIQDWWSKEGFKDVKAQTYKWSEPFQARLRKVTGDDPAMAVEMVKDLDEVVPDLVAKVRRSAIRNADGNISDENLAKALKSEMENLSEIDGRALMAIRNKFAIAGNSGSKWKSGVNRKIKRTFDEEIRTQLRDKGLDPAEILDEQLEAYRVFKAYDGAVDKAWDAKGGAFDYKDFLRASPKDIDAPMVARSQGLSKSTKQAKAAAERKADKVKKVSEGRIVEAKKAAEIEKLQMSGQKKLLKRTLAKEKKNAIDELEARIDKYGRQRGAETQLKKARDQLATLKSLSPAKDATGLSMMLTTGLLGSVGGSMVGGPAGGIAGLALGTQWGKLLASKSGQKAFAGQTKKQRQLAAHLRRNRNKYRGAAQGAYRTVALQNKGEDN